MEKKSRIKIVDTNYNEDFNLVQWKVNMLEDDKEIVLAWRGNDLGDALGITKEIPPDLMKKFCKDMIGKEINLVISSDTDQFDVEKFAQLKPEEMQNVINDLEKKYPFYEVEYLEKKEGKSND